MSVETAPLQPSFHTPVHVHHTSCTITIMDPKVSEKPHAASEEDELANLLKDSLAQFDTTRNDSPEHGGPMENVDPPHKKWLAPFKKARHPDRKAKVFKPIARNLDKIQMVMEGVGFIIKSVSTVSNSLTLCLCRPSQDD